MTLPEMVAALERAAQTTAFYIGMSETEDEIALRRLASLLKGAQEACLISRYSQSFISFRKPIENDAKRVYIVPAEEEK